MHALAATVASASATVASTPSAMVKETLHSRLIAAALMAMPPLKRRPLLELRSYLKPPPLIVRVWSACILLHTEPTWESAKLELADALSSAWELWTERRAAHGRGCCMGQCMWTTPPSRQKRSQRLRRRPQLWLVDGAAKLWVRFGKPTGVPCSGCPRTRGQPPG